ncbi:hypothetical protein ACFWGC_26920 [Cytobacillus pseudoceanisediminis]|uniref:hypothetical protein n=1 Tax=Cytobacillus pseudoceanisediminis TaxID=3051614 RepID=UPI003658FDB9
MVRYFDIPTKTQLKDRTKYIIVNSSNSELEGLYNKVIYNIKHCPAPSLIAEFKEEKEWILKEMKKRNIKPPTLFNNFLNWIRRGQ